MFIWTGCTSRHWMVHMNSKIAYARVVSVSIKMNRKRNKWAGILLLVRRKAQVLKKCTTEIMHVSSKKNTSEHLKLLRFVWITWLLDQWIILIQDYWNTEYLLLHYCWGLLCSIWIGILQAHRIHRCSTSPRSIPGYREILREFTSVALHLGVKCIINYSDNLYWVYQPTNSVGLSQITGRINAQSMTA